MPCSVAMERLFLIFGEGQSDFQQYKEQKQVPKWGPHFFFFSLPCVHQE